MVQRIGARELKTRLGSYLRRVRQGATLVVTERGEPVAELRPFAEGGDEEAVLERLAALGAITRGSGKPLAPFKPVRLRGGTTLSKAVIEDREDRF